MTYKIEIIERKDPIVQLEASKLSIKDLFSNLLNGEIEFAPVYFNSVTTTVVNHRFRLENSFQEILYLIDNWINKWSG